MLIINKNTLLIANNNNFKGRTYFIKVKLNNDLNSASFNQPNINKNAWINNNTKPNGFDFGNHTFFGWATTVFMYFLVSIKTGYQANVANINKDNSYFWLGLTIVLIFLGFNKQLDLQTNFTEWLRATSKMHGWYEQRRGVQFLFVLLMGLAIPMMLISLRVFLFNSWRRYKLTWIGIVVLLVFVSVRVASFHHVDLFFYKTIGSLRYYQALEMLAIGLIFVGTFYENKLVKLNQNNKSEINNFVEIKQDDESIVCPKCYKRLSAEAKDGRFFRCKFCKHVYQIKLLS